jgi:hypothetical protein
LFGRQNWCSDKGLFRERQERRGKRRKAKLHEQRKRKDKMNYGVKRSSLLRERSLKLGGKIRRQEKKQLRKDETHLQSIRTR